MTASAGGIKLKELLLSAELAELTLVAGQKGLDRLVSRANIYADLEILDWVSKGEILLMTELNVQAWAAGSLSEFIRRLAALGLSALALKPSSSDFTFEPQALAEANKLKFPILKIPPQLSIADFSAAVFRAVFQHQQLLLEKHKELNEALQNCLLDQGDAAALLAVVQAHLTLPLFLICADFQISQGSWGNEGKKGELFAADAKQAVVDSLTLPQLTYSHNEVVVIGKQRYNRVMLTVRNKDKHFGQLFAWSEQRRFSVQEQQGLELAANALALRLMQELAWREAEIRHSSEFVAELLNASKRTHALDRAGLYKLDANDNHCVILLSFNNEAQAGAQLARQELQHVLCQNMPWLEQSLHRHELKGLLAQRGDCLEVVIALSSAAIASWTTETRRKLTVFAQELKNNLELRMQQSRSQARIGIGRYYEGLSQLSRSYNEAERAIWLGARLFERPLLFFEDLGIFRILTQDSVNEEMEHFFYEMLAVLIAYDQRRGTELMQTLECYFRNNGNINKTSEELFTHYNTVLYRLDRIQEISGKSLNDPNDRLNLELALKLRALVQK